MRFVVFALTFCFLLPGWAIAKGRKDTVVERTTSGGVRYALRLPVGWNRKDPLPLVLHVPQPTRMPGGCLEAETFSLAVERARAVTKKKVVHCAALLKAHNKEDAFRSKNFDRDRFLRLLESDVPSVDAVLDAVLQELPIQEDAIAIAGYYWTPDMAIGIAVRRPKRFSCVMLKTMRPCTVVERLGTGAGPLAWLVLPDDEALAPALGIPILMVYDPEGFEPEVKREFYGSVRDVLVGRGFKRVEIILGEPKRSQQTSWSPPALARFLELVDVQRVRARHEEERDGIVAAARAKLEMDRLPDALKEYRKARALEVKHELDPASDTLYELLEAKGRDLLKAADALSASKRRSAYRKVARLFKGLPLAEEVAAALDADR